MALVSPSGPRSPSRVWIGKVSTCGALDEVALYDKALPPARVKAHFDAAGR